MTEKTCSTCRFWGAADECDEGPCHRYPPVLNHSMVASQPENDDGNASMEESYKIYCWAYPVTGEDEWCGEWQEKTE